MHKKGKLTLDSFFKKKEQYEKQGVKKADYVKHTVIVKKLKEKGIGTYGFEQGSKTDFISLLIFLFSLLN